MSDTTPQASPEPPGRIALTPPPEAIQILDNENRGYLPPPPVPPPRTFGLQKGTDAMGSVPSRLSFVRAQSAKSHMENSPRIQDSDKFFRSKKRSSDDSREGEDHQNLTIRRREYNVHVATTHIEYITKVNFCILISIFFLIGLLIPKYLIGSQRKTGSEYRRQF